MKKAVFLDRDGIINKTKIIDGKPYPPKDLKGFEFIDNIKETLFEIKNSGFLLIIITNQPDVARGTLNIEEVEKINKYIVDNIPIDKIYTCYHDNKDNCECRKPKAGMIYKASKKFSVKLDESFVVGDRWRDIDAGNEAGCKTIFVDYGYNEKLNSKPTFVVKTVKDILLLIKGEI